MSKEEIKDYLKRVDELETKLTGKDKETYAWLIYGFNQCAKLLNETEQQVEKQKEFIKYLEDEIKRINPKELDIGELNLRLDDIKFTQYLIYKEILQKYKEIIGDNK